MRIKGRKRRFVVEARVFIRDWCVIVCVIKKDDGKKKKKSFFVKLRVFI